MNKEEIRAKAEAVWDSFLETELPPVNIIEAALTKVWNLAVEAAATAYCGEYCKSTRLTMLEFKVQQIRRLRIEEEP